MNRYSIYIQREGETAAVNSVEEWNVAVTSICTDTDGGFRDFTSREWADEDGEDVYVPATPRLKAFDAKWKVCYKGDADTAYEKLEAMREKLAGALLDIYDTYSSHGYAGCYLKEFGDPTYTRNGNEDVLQFSITFRVTKPRTKVILTQSNGVNTLTEN